MIVLILLEEFVQPQKFHNQYYEDNAYKEESIRKEVILKR